MDPSTVVRAAIHPSIGVARVGDSPEDFFIGPEVPDSHPMPEDGFRDAGGRIKRQAARFRIYGYDANGNVVGELNGARGVDVSWTVEVANLKAGWYDFELAMDIPEAPSAKRRNIVYAGDARDQLMIRPGARTVSGPGSRAAFDDGRFFDESVYLGEVRTDADERLLFLGGHGKSASVDGRPVYTFANNDGWHDDVCDGPVRAELSIDGRSVPVDSGWVVTAPPNYAPELKSTVTMYDLLTQVMILAGWREAPRSVSFREHIYPLFERMQALQWVNKGLFTQFGFGGPSELTAPRLLERLASASPRYAELRRQIFNSFRAPDFSDRQRLAWPWIYGDAMNLPADSDRQWFAIPPFMYAMLSRWADGDFVEDLDANVSTPVAIDDVPVDRQPATLDRASLDYCLADAFHPGCEMTWPVRHTSLFTGPYRVLPLGPQEPEPDYGDTLSPSDVFAGELTDPSNLYGAGVPGGPLFAQPPGGLTRWMAVPWQTDTASCRDGYIKSYDEYVPTFWPARVPNQVLTEASYGEVMNALLPAHQREAAFDRRCEWLRTLTGDNYPTEIASMITEFGNLGIVERRPGPAGDVELPSSIWVEDRVVPGGAPADAVVDRAELAGTDKANAYRRRPR